MAELPPVFVFFWLKNALTQQWGQLCPFFFLQSLLPLSFSESGAFLTPLGLHAVPPDGLASDQSFWMVGFSRARFSFFFFPTLKEVCQFLSILDFSIRFVGMGLETPGIFG